MGMYDGPHFGADDEQVVSIWAAKCPLADIPNDYFQENYGGEDDEPFNQFSSDFGFGFYDHDFVETYCTDDWQIVPIEQLLKPLSYSELFIKHAVNRAVQVGLGHTAYVILLYHFKYDSAVTGISESPYMRFVATIPYALHG